MPGPFKNRAAQIAALRKKTAKYKVPFPNLKCEQRDGVAPISNTMSAIVPKAASGFSHPDAISFPVGHCHKQGLELITPGTIAKGELKYMGGQKAK